ncbi:AGE family epimerase/isomerase [Parapedobacter lycopersici]|uniref:AGE family epimerase/isomerase n=1 Tax=Parapedobacter lycopersici TaxID=1864939 RepID=UPI00214D5C68|nr:AGE family epimerase/isomerase [Parapedobacter lycopersici]
MNSSDYSKIYKASLLTDVMPFWLAHSRDEKGGYFTCLDRQGKVFDTDKFIWLQGRQVWMLSTLYNQVERRPEWLEFAQHGADFLLKNGRDETGNFYFALNREGRPLVQPYNIFSDCFAAMGLGALYSATNEDQYGEIARQTFLNIIARRDNTKGKYNKQYPGTRDLKGFSLPMILSNLSVELEHILDRQLVETLIDEVIHEVMNVFYQPDSGLILENVYADGSFSDSFDGRLVNPGHVLEAMWFMMDLAVRRNDPELIAKAVAIALRALDFGWDTEHGGILYFKDIKGHPTQQLEWDQKLWWVHIEAMICMAKAWLLTDNTQCRDWFNTLHEYTYRHFSDPEYGEWFGYLNRRGEVLLPLKGGKWKGCFHVPRGLLQLGDTMDAISAKRSR